MSLKKFVLLLLLPALYLFADTNAQPAPSLDKPRRAVVQVSLGDDKALNGVLNNINNLLKAYEPGELTVAVIAWGDGIRLLQKKSNPFVSRVKAFMDVDVEFIACKNTMAHKNLKADDMIDGVSFVQTGLKEIIERELSGWSYLKP